MAGAGVYIADGKSAIAMVNLMLKVLLPASSHSACTWMCIETSVVQFWVNTVVL